MGSLRSSMIPLLSKRIADGAGNALLKLEPGGISKTAIFFAPRLYKPRSSVVIIIQTVQIGVLSISIFIMIDIGWIPEDSTGRRYGAEARESQQVRRASPRGSAGSLYIRRPDACQGDEISKSEDNPCETAGGQNRRGVFPGH